MTIRKSALGQFGVGGAQLAPGGGSGTPNLPEVVRSFMDRCSAPYADAAALTASKAADRADGQLAVRLDDYSLWVWQAASTASAGSTVIVPTDVGVGAGRWVRKVALGTPPTAAAKARTSFWPFSFAS